MLANMDNINNIKTFRHFQVDEWDFANNQIWTLHFSLNKKRSVISFNSLSLIGKSENTVNILLKGSLEAAELVLFLCFVMWGGGKLHFVKSTWMMS